MTSKKRKLNEENRVFNTQWELDYFFIFVKDKMICLLCNAALTSFKKSNAHQHYLTHKDHKYAKLEGEAREAALQKLKKEKKNQQAGFSAFLNRNVTITDASYKIAHLLGKKGKPFSDVDTIKDCIIEAVNCLDPDKVAKYKELPLSRRTITDRQHDLAQNITDQLREILQDKNVYFSLALDESTDKTDSAQVLYFIRAITNDFCCYEELLAMGTMIGRTRGIDILNNFKEICHQSKLNLDHLVSVCTDGAPSMKGKREGFVSLLKKENSNLEKLISFHCILHQQNLCAKSTTLHDTMDKVIGIVNFIRVNALRHREFRQMLALDDETDIIDLPFYCKVRWLSRGQILSKVLSVQEQILTFYQDQGKPCELSDKEFCRNVAFLSDIMTKQNDLNISLQGKTKHIYDMWTKIQVFSKKLTFLKNLLSCLDVPGEHFPQLSKMLDKQKYKPDNLHNYIDVLDSLIEEFSERFLDFKEHVLEMKLTFEPHLIDISEAPTELQMELIELGEDNNIKSLFYNKTDMIEIWKNAVEYPRLRQHARRMLSCFGSTYCCESTFSYMTQIKSNLRTQITNEHLEDQLKLRVSKLEPNIQLLSKKKQIQKSH